MRARGRRAGPALAAWMLPLALGAVLPAHAHCLAIQAVDGAALAALPLAPAATFALRYRHSVTQTPVEERYRHAGGHLVQTELRFVEHGPGLPAQAAEGERWSHESGEFVVRMAREHAAIPARVDPAQSPKLVVADQVVDLAQWGRRAIRILPTVGACTAP